jgi:hypothetical protein
METTKIKKSQVLLFLFGLMFLSCTNDNETSYLIWTDSMSYSEYSSSYGSLNDGYYVRKEYTVSEFNQIKPTLTNDNRKKWTEEQILNWFIGRGFGNDEANKEKAWLVTIDHGFVASRTGNVVYLLWK